MRWPQLVFVCVTALGTAGWADRPFLDFETPSDLTRVHVERADLAIAASHAASGRHSMKVTLHAGDYPSVAFRVGEAFPGGDWRPYQSLELDFYLDVANKPGPSGPSAMSLFFEFASGSGATARQRAFVAGFSGKRQGHMSFTTVGLQLGAEGLLASGTGFGRVAAWGTNVDPADMQRFTIVVDHLDKPVTLYLDNLRFTPHSDKPIVDEFGQYNLREWQGKVHSEEELRAAGQRDLAELAKPIRRADRDQYGGWTAGADRAGRRLGFAPGGHFEVRRRDGRWWLVTPDGNPFWSAGCDGLMMEATSPKWDDAHKALYGWLPPHEGRFAGVWENSWTGGPVLVKANLVRRYGADYATAWRRVSARRLLDWGFNSLGAWCDTEIAKQPGTPLPYTVCLSGAGDPAPEMAAGLPDVYHPAWEAGVVRAAQGTAKYRDDPWCIGYFYDNELGWSGGWQAKPTVAQQVLARGPDSAAKHALVALLKERYAGGIAPLNAAWHTAFAGFDDILPQPVKLAPEGEAGAERDFSAFLEATANRYYATVARELKAADPNHLYLGSRLAQHPIEAVRAAGRYCDVVSFNIYTLEVDRAEYDRLYAAAHRPFIVGEFNTGARDRGLLAGGGVDVENQAERGAAYRHYVEHLASVPYFVGCHWFDWTDQPCVGRFDGWESGNSGIVDVCFNGYRELTDAMTKANGAVYGIANRPSSGR